jgi:hypothetical protein
MVFTLSIAAFLLQFPTSVQDIEDELLSGFVYSLRPRSVSSVIYVSERTGKCPFLLGSIASQESGGGREGTLLYCTEFIDVDGGKRCARSKQKSCWKDCTRDGVWENRLDIGLWGIRDAPEPGSSWLRRYRRVTGRSVAEDCPVDRRCASRLMVWIVGDLQKWTPRQCVACSGVNGWLTRWNGCSSCGRHVSRSFIKYISFSLRHIAHLAVEVSGI